MSSPAPTQAVANLHLHLEYDSGLDVIAAAMATVPEGHEDTDEHRAHVSHDISSAVAHLLDVEAITPAGCPVRVTDVSMEVVVDIDGPHNHGDDESPEPEFEKLLAMAEEFATVFDGLDLTEDEAQLVAQAMVVAEVTGPPPFDEIPDDMTVPQLLAEWGILCGYLAEACASVVDAAFDDLYQLTSAESHGREFISGTTVMSWRLPDRWADEYDTAFLRRFILTLGEVTTRLSHEWEQPSNIAQFLALSVILDEVADQIEADQDELSDSDVRRPSDSLLDLLRNRVVDLEIVESIFESGDPALGIEHWFTPFTSVERVAPYASDELG